MPDETTVEIGVGLLSQLNGDELALSKAVDRIETVTTDPATTRAILDTAELRGVIERTEGMIQTTGGSSIELQHDVVTRGGDFDCQRCGSSLSTGYFIQLESGEHGPFGPTCVRTVLDC